jgi:3-hydroxyisobutyrate dehydrogenase-like beta-hydroxyacid dehydrogenase
MSPVRSICLLGFGEVGQTLAADLAERGGVTLRSWDILFSDPQSRPSLAAACSRATPATDLRAAASAAGVIISAVTAAQCVAAARSASVHLANGAYFVDLNSVSPATKVEAARVVADAGGRYVESAVMAPIGPKRIATPMLLGGPHAAEFLPLARELGFAGASVYAAELGRASAAKMCRSIIIKGMEALLGESLLTARRYGVDGTVLESLRDLFPGADWPELGRYMISRSLQHGKRRAEEMREVAVTASEAGIEPLMSSAIAGRQDWAAQFAEAAQIKPLTELLDAVLDSVPENTAPPLRQTS